MDTSPVRQRQLEELDMVSLCVEILSDARNELYMNMKFLDVALSSLYFEADPGCSTMGTDGYGIFYRPEFLLSQYQKGRVLINRAYLHMVLHCLFCHLDTRGKRAEDYWNLACDIAIESMIDGMYVKCIHVQPSPFRREIYLRLSKELPVLTAGGIYRQLQQMELDERQYLRLAAEFCIDDHRYWKQDRKGKSGTPRQKDWQQKREQMETNMETFAREAAEDSKELMEQVRAANREGYDYRTFLKKFSVWKEEMETDPDSFDYGFYAYGLELYGNMPLIEPQETREVFRVEEFVIVVDTSMSCSGELVKRFLEETYGVLSEGESYFRKINIHIIQCDEKIQEDHVVTSREEMEQYLEHFTVRGFGGTDFRPAFTYVSALIGRGEFHKLKGLIYFTDGEGIYPVKRPPYETAFVFIRGKGNDSEVPPWAIRIMLEPEDLEEKEEAGEHLL